MTYEELNVVRNLKKKLDAEVNKLSALRDLVRPATTKFTRETVDGKSYTCLDVMPHGTNTASPTETLATMITDAERRIANLKRRIENESLTLANKIQVEVQDAKEQALLIHRYISCKHFRDIGFAMGISEANVYFSHRKILKKLIVADSSL